MGHHRRMLNTSRTARTIALLGLVLAACEPSPGPRHPQNPATSSTTLSTTSAEAASPATIPSSPTSQPPPDWAALVASSDRDEADRSLDAGRKPAELLEFCGIRPRQKVGEVASGGGYTAELLARAVGPEGHVWGQNSPFILQRFAETPWAARLQKPIMANVTRVDSEFDTPFPADALQLDAVLNVLFYHDTVWQKTDRSKMNRNIFDALRSGGVYCIVDHSAAAGSGLTQVETLHRIEESVLRQEIQAAGFKLDAEASFLRNPEDARDWSASPRVAGERRGQSDRFVLRFVKP
jgi:predicted methyltransferase